MMGVGDIWLCEIPICRCTVEQHTKEMKMAKEHYLGFAGKSGEPHLAKHRKRLELRFEAVEWYPWQYNEVIGWIEVHTFGSQIRGDLWLVKQRVSRTLKHKTFYCLGKLFEYSCLLKNDDTLTSALIHADLKRTITAMLAEADLDKYHTDFRFFDSFGKLIDWKALLKMDQCSGIPTII